MADQPTAVSNRPLFYVILLFALPVAGGLVYLFCLSQFHNGFQHVGLYRPFSLTLLVAIFSLAYIAEAYLRVFFSDDRQRAQQDVQEEEVQLEDIPHAPQAAQRDPQQNAQPDPLFHSFTGLLAVVNAFKDHPRHWKRKACGVIVSAGVLFTWASPFIWPTKTVSIGIPTQFRNLVTVGQPVDTGSMIEAIIGGTALAGVVSLETANINIPWIHLPTRLVIAPILPNNMSPFAVNFTVTSIAFQWLGGCEFGVVQSVTNIGPQLINITIARSDGLCPIVLPPVNTTAPWYFNHTATSCPDGSADLAYRGQEVFGRFSPCNLDSQNLTNATVVYCNSLFAPKTVKLTADAKTREILEVVILGDGISQELKSIFDPNGQASNLAANPLNGFAIPKTGEVVIDGYIEYINNLLDLSKAAYWGTPVMKNTTAASEGFLNSVDPYTPELMNNSLALADKINLVQGLTIAYNYFFVDAGSANTNTTVNGTVYELQLRMIMDVPAKIACWFIVIYMVLSALFLLCVRCLYAKPSPVKSSVS